ncbi:MAG: MATE family efflux transporter [Chloroflexia bacterium]|nr:MATE family efflux transporter [Chloroflexia bacterium]
MKLSLSIRLPRRRPAGSVRFWDSLQGEILRLAIPAVGEQLLSLMVGLVDTFLVGHLGQQALAAVGLANQWVMMATTLFGAVAVGTTALIARAVGGKDWKLANRALRQSILLGVGIGLTAMVLGLSLAGPLVRLLGSGADAYALQMSTTYLRVVASIFALSTLMFIANAAMRGAGDTRTPFIIMLVVNLLNAGLAWLLVNGKFGLPELGVTGSAIGAAVGRGVGGLLALGLLLRGRRGLRLARSGLRPDRALIGRILRVGLPSGAESMLFRIAQMIFFSIVAGLGTATIAAQQVAINATSISFLPGFGFAVAATTLVGQNLGAHQPGRAERSGYVAFAWGVAIMVVLGLLLFAFPGAFMRFFTTDVEVIELGMTPLRIIALAQPALAAAMIFAGGLRGAGDTMAPLWINNLSLWSVRIPLAVLFTQGLSLLLPAAVNLPSWLGNGLGWGLSGAWLAMSLDMVIRGTSMLLRFRGGRWKLIRV